MRTGGAADITEKPVSTVPLDSKSVDKGDLGSFVINIGPD